MNVLRGEFLDGDLAPLPQFVRILALGDQVAAEAPPVGRPPTEVNLAQVESDHSVWLRVLMVKGYEREEGLR